MDDLFTLHPGTVFLRREALAAGYEDADLRNLKRAGVIRSVRHGAYAAAEVYDAADDIERFRLRGRAVLLSHGGRVALSHTSAAVELGIELYRPDLSEVHVVRLDGGHGAVDCGVRHHRRTLALDPLVEHGEWLLVDPVAAALGAASLHSQEAGLVALDSAVNRRLCTVEELLEGHSRRAHHPHSRRLQVVVRLARAGAESPLESRVRYFFFRHHLPEPELQVEVRDADGRLVGRTDMTWHRHRGHGEVDGQGKYGPLLLPGQDLREVVRQEKEREDAIREASGYGMIRFTSQHLRTPARTEARVRRFLRI